jgi:hypothetical protein
MSDDYNPFHMFRRDVFANACDYIDSDNLSIDEVVSCLKNCIEFFMGGADDKITRDFCIAKMRSVDDTKQG